MGRKVLITGASRGIGREIAISFAGEKDELFLTCRNSMDELNKLADSLRDEFGAVCHAVQCDMSDYGQVEKLFSNISDIDIVVNNAGIAWMGLLTDMSTEDWDNVMGTNINSMFYTSRLAVPMMVRKQSGRIINISSVWGNVGASCEVAYSASKGAVNAFTRALAKELAPSNIQVNAIACGVIDTDMNRAHLDEEELVGLTEEIPAGRMGDPREVAELVMKLTETPLYLTGQVITLDGAWI
jgi:3-oxoacyl-[acyl-carrier protein] reductase